MDNIYSESLDLHRKKQGKLEVKSKVELKSRKDLSLAYTPGVAEVCKEINKDKAKSFTHTFRGNTIAVISDGSAVLGLGNVGPEAGLPVMEGKAVLFKELAGVNAFPICLDTQDTEEIIKTIKHLAPSFAAINLEDISAPRCFEIETRLKEELSIPVIHDDQHITAVVVLAGIINSIKLRGSLDKKEKIVINGAGAAGTAILKLFLHYGFEDIIICDSKGIINKDRQGLNSNKLELVEISNSRNIKGKLEDAIVDADIFIGVSVSGALSPEMIGNMKDKPIIFALANPVPEIMPNEAISAGAFVVATGRSDFNNQVNNVLAFPGIFRGLIDNKVENVEVYMLIRAAEVIASAVTDLNINNILPNPLDREVPKMISEAIKNID
ncbi:MAG: NADP-dependent malic enzyme [Parcubacteria group bacterium]